MTYSIEVCGCPIGNGVGCVIAGNGDMLLLHQWGDGAILDILQPGDRNRLFLRQTGVTQRLNMPIEGSDNDGALTRSGFKQECLSHLARLDAAKMEAFSRWCRADRDACAPA